MEEEKRYSHNSNRQRGGRGRGPRPNFQSRGGRGQRPLLTSSINASGLCLVALAISVGAMNPGLSMSASQALGLAVIAFTLSAVISYVAQRTPKKWVEKVSDAFFLLGTLVVLYVAGVLAGFWGLSII